MMNNYGIDVQKLFLEITMQDAQSYVRVQNIFNEENFDLLSILEHKEASKIKIELARRNLKRRLNYE